MIIVDNKSGDVCEETGVISLNMMSGNLPGRYEEGHENFDQDSQSPPRMGTRHTPNANQAKHLCLTLSGWQIINIAYVLYDNAYHDRVVGMQLRMCWAEYLHGDMSVPWTEG
jgi:hypothetical protein